MNDYRNDNAAPSASPVGTVTAVKGVMINIELLETDQADSEECNECGQLGCDEHGAGFTVQFTPCQIECDQCADCRRHDGPCSEIHGSV